MCQKVMCFLNITITDGPSGAKVPKYEIGIGTEISLKMNKKIEFASKLTKKIPLKMLVSLKKL